jgi:hypothetical protein
MQIAANVEPAPVWMGLVLIAIGTSMLVAVPFVARRIRENPVGCLRQEWVFLGPRAGRAVGVAVAAVAGGFGLFFLSLGIRILRAGS